MFELIKELTELVGPVGQEGIVLDHIEKLWRRAGRKDRAHAGGQCVGTGKRVALGKRQR